jgi:hypothetical protein
MVAGMATPFQQVRRFNQWSMATRGRFVLVCGGIMGGLYAVVMLTWTTGWSVYNVLVVSCLSAVYGFVMAAFLWWWLNLMKRVFVAGAEWWLRSRRQ